MTTHTVSVFRESLKFVNHHWKTLVKVALIPFIITLALNMWNRVDPSFNPEGIGQRSIWQLSLLKSLACEGIAFFMYVVWQSQWMRYSINPHLATKCLEIDKITFKFLGYYTVFPLFIGLPLGLLLGLSLALTSIGVSILLPYILGVLCIAGVIFLAIKFCFIFPAVACGEATGFKKSWQQTKGVGGKLCAVMLKAISLMALLLIPCVILGMIFKNPFASFIFEGLQQIISFYMIAVVWTATARLYLEAKGK